MTLDKVLMPVLDGHPDVFDREWPLHVADIERCGWPRLDALFTIRPTRHLRIVGRRRPDFWANTGA